MSAGNGDSHGHPPPQVALSRRLNLLVDAAAEKRGYDVTFREIQEQLAARGVKISRARWFYMKDGTRALVTDKRVLTAICELFEVDPTYLLDLSSDVLPRNIESRLEFVKALRMARVQAFAARTLADVAPETLDAITDFLRHGTPSNPDDVKGLDRLNTEGELPGEP